MLQHNPHVLSPLSEMETHSSSNLRARKMSTGGNRSWSEEEENYLLQTRMQKMPYKHIAAHLKKTELACRLHYHQLSHGSHRRKRTPSVSSTTSSNSAGQSPAYAVAVEHDQYAQDSRHGSPMSYTGNSPGMRSGSLNTSPNRNHKILLPKPCTLTPRESPEPHNALRIHTDFQQPRAVDTDRLRAIYEARRAQFWATVAADYGADVSPAQLEEIWRSGHQAVRPPTPDTSPDGSILSNPVLKPSPLTYGSPMTAEPGRNYSAVSAPERLPYVLPMPIPSAQRQRSSTWSAAPRENVPIASLLTEDKNPRKQE
ncbi:hypothetical protein GQ43DRAFT_362202 [Delitschia confertaspora ATCC 74209]|uniref:Myb-like domain-containing protein n=1 Tax=Delitschia confertaspora ATCC 74209 TaxID=1513339 RepID=A0A9P4JW27_9PLEO|nr:hypothetical protein GQ43DRAFT_362202 [Delitschia confertaspora ATCC 74209]